LFQNEYIRFFLGTLVGKRKQTIFKKRWFDITTSEYATVAVSKQNVLDKETK
jgi:hypothetical protein